jgi:hypothetical protein
MGHLQLAQLRIFECWDTYLAKQAEHPPGAFVAAVHCRCIS